MRHGTLYFREELDPFTKRIDFELAHFLDAGEIIKHYRGIYSRSGSRISDETIISKIMKRDGNSSHLIIPAGKIRDRSYDLSSFDYICLNSKRSDLISASNFKIKFKIPTHGFPKTLTENFLIIYQLNISLDPEKLFLEMNLDIAHYEQSFIKDLKKYGNKRTYKIITDKINQDDELKKIASSLSSIGAPLIIESKSSKPTPKTTIEDIISEALLIGMNEPRIHNTLPFTILKNSSKIDFKRLRDLTRKNGTFRYAGFLLELLKRAGFDNAPEFKPPKYSKEPTILFESSYGRRGLQRLKTNHLDFALDKWGILIDSSIDSERDKIRKWL